MFGTYSASWPAGGLATQGSDVGEQPIGHEIVYAEQVAQGKAIRAITIEEIYNLIEKFAKAAWRVQHVSPLRRHPDYAENLIESRQWFARSGVQQITPYIFNL